MGRERESTFYDDIYAHQPRRARQIAYSRHKFIAPWIVGESVFDLGCGVCLIANLIDRSISYIGVDFSEEAIAASNEIIKNPEQASVFCCSIEEAHARFEDQRFDTVLMIEVLEHLSDPLSALEVGLAHCKRRLIVTVPRDMRAPDHVKQKWTEEEIREILGDLTELRLFGGPDDNWWWFAVKDLGGA